MTDNEIIKYLEKEVKNRRLGYDNTRLATVSELKEHITSNEEWYSIPHLQHTVRPYTLNDYCDMRKCVDMTRFKYCPLCGAKIDWKAIKESDNDTR